MVEGLAEMTSSLETVDCRDLQGAKALRDHTSQIRWMEEISAQLRILNIFTVFSGVEGVG